MADADEDVIPRSGLTAEDVDLSDETQDFRFLATISSDDAKVPKRGEKDFEPHATALQSNTLAASRQAMHTVLAYPRVHQPKIYTMATYHPQSNMAYAYNPKGPLFAKMGQVLPVHEDPLGNDGRRGQRVWLLPEEILYLIERGSVDVRWPPTDDEVGGVGLPLSLQGAYAMFIGDEASHGGSLTFERYSVYSGLKRMGYTVLRAPSWSGSVSPPGPECRPSPERRTWQAGFLDYVRVWRLFISPRHAREETHTEGPLVSDAFYRSYAEIYRRLALIDFYNPASNPSSNASGPPASDADLHVTFHVWKPGSQTFKKSAPGPPDFRIAVVNARETAVPTLQQFDALFATVPYDPPKVDAQLYQKLKYGYKNVILAIVDQGITSYLRMADAGFGCEKLYDRKGRGPGGKWGGRGGGRGGRGRGR